MIVVKFKIGDRVRIARVRKDRQGMVSTDLIGGVFTIRTDCGENSWGGGIPDKDLTGSWRWFEDELELAKEAPQGPVRTKTVTEIVPGEYGIVRILETPQTPFPMHVNLRIDHGLSSAEELRAAALVLTQLAGALEE